MESAALPSELEYQAFYSRFGGAYAASELIHGDLCMLHALKDITVVSQTTRARFVEKLNFAESRTMGQLVRDLEGILPVPLAEAIEDLLDARNYLAHEFWRRRAPLLLSTAQGVASLAEEVSNYMEEFQRSRAMLQVHTQAVFDRLGIVRDDGEPRSLEDYIAWVERPRDTLPRQVRIVRLWKLPHDDSYALVFESESAGLLQLCDVGLSRSPFEQVEATWMPMAEVNEFLPAATRTRPPAAQPWEYQLELKARRILWVRPGPPGTHFEWGLGRR